MLDWLRYFPLALRRGSLTNRADVKGPYFSSLRPHQWNFGDSKLHFSIPRTNPILGSSRYGSPSPESRTPGQQNILNFQISDYRKDIMPNKRWQYDWFFFREWYFVGQWFSGLQAFFIMSTSIIGQTTRDDFSGTSFFHPRVFETAIADYLSSYYGHEKAGRKARYRGPMNWKILPISPTVQAVCLDIHTVDQCSDNPNLQRCVFIPVSHQRFIRIVFNYGGTRILDEKVNPQPLFDLNDAIINSLRLEVGPTMQSQWEEVKAYCPDMSLTPDFAEIKWPIKPEDVGKALAAPPSPANADLLEITSAVKQLK